MFLFFPNCRTAHLDTNLIEARQSELLNSLLQKFQPCQITLLAMHSSYIRFFSRNTQSIQIFVIPVNNTEEIILKILKVNRKVVYPVLYGLQYTHKFSTPVCKLNAVVSSSPEEIIGFVTPFLKIFRISFNNNPMFRSVYCKSKMFNLMLLNKQNRSDSIAQILRDISATIPLIIRIFRYWTVSLMPMKEEFLSWSIRIQIWFTALKFDTFEILKSDSYVFVDELTCQAGEEQHFCNSV